MIFYCIGIDYEKTPLAVRELAFWQREEITRFWKAPDREAEALFTCNRVEVYGVAKDRVVLEKDIFAFKRKFSPVFKQIYLKLGLNQVIRYALRVACGLESQILAENQILQQIDSWISQEPFSQLIRDVWSEVLDVARSLRQEVGLSRNQSNLSEIVLEDLILNTGWGIKKKVLIVGTGKVAQIFTENRFPDVDLYFFARKRIKKARRLAKKLSAKALLLEDLAEELRDADGLIAATSSRHYILRKEFLARAVQLRKKPLYIYDLALPRDIDSQAVDIPGVFLKNLDDLDTILKRHNGNFRIYAQLVRDLIEAYIPVIEGEISGTLSKGRKPAKSASFAAG